jgi:hypothetical protein
MEFIKDESLPRVLTLDVSQYTVGDEGRSACTAISVEAAAMLLKHLNAEVITANTSGSSSSGDTAGKSCIEDKEILTEVLFSGLAGFSRARDTLGAQGPGDGVEHMSAGEYLALTEARGGSTLPLHITGIGVQQGLLSTPGALSSVLHPPLTTSAPTAPTTSAAADAGTLTVSQPMYTAVVLTKPPETVLLLLPPSTTSPQRHPHFLFDSHPRPELGLAGACLFTCDSAHALEDRLRLLYGDCDTLLENDQSIPEYLKQLYHAFEATPLQRVERLEP